MACTDLSEELNCSLCLNLYADPVSLKCGHIFCQACIEAVLDNQKASGRYSCPECRTEYLQRPKPKRIRKLCNIVELYQENTKIPCSFCTTSSPKPAVKTCVNCEFSLCEKHLTSHNRTKADHVLVEPTTSFEIKKCAIHKKPLEFYCTEDDTCLCTYCFWVGEHKGHDVISLEDAANKKKETLRNQVDKLTPRIQKIDQKVHSLQDHSRKLKGKSDLEKQKATDLYKEIRRHLQVQETQVQNKISSWEQQIQVTVSDRIKKLVSQKDNLSGKKDLIEQLILIPDPVNLLQQKSPDVDDLCKNQDLEENKDASVPDLDGALVSMTVHKSITDFINNANLKAASYIAKVSDMLLDGNSAHVNVTVSDDRKMASSSTTPQTKTELPGRFKYWSQVTSTKNFPSGRHYWEVEIGGSGVCELGICYTSMERQGETSSIGDNQKSWGLRITERKFTAVHNSSQQQLPRESSCTRYWVYLDYGSGRLSFYQLCDPILHLYTFTATFTEPLHAAFFVDDGAWVKICS
ncbi:E3 ubiquitin/ISG15 ligase TRIM25-like [Hyperolius riggenbachi]|uniref:E3 ubiquitin/ISG15 ligase TRIM25-like n=1 Tax=Hyperolius riggenbachi TaxID=752182 RepID=UPI0035A2BA66